jgi:hypothetical protein
MGTLNSVTLEFGGGEYAFALNGREIEELEKACGVVNEKGQLIPVGFGAIFQRLILGVWRGSDIYHTIRLGLEGGGMAAVPARRIADGYAVPPYLSGTVGGPEQTAIAIANAAMHGVGEIEAGDEADPPGEQMAGE